MPAGWITHPAALAFVFFLVALIALFLLVPLIIVVSVGAILILLGALALGASIGLRQFWGIVVSILVVAVGVLVLAFGVTVGFKG